MGRKLLHSKQEFMKAYKKAKSIPELASALHIAVCTTYTYIMRYKAKPYFPPGNKKLNPLKIGAQYGFDVTIEDLALKYHTSWSSIHHCLRKLILYPDIYSLTSTDTNSDKYWPPPKTLPEIKIVNLIKKHSKFVDNPWPMMDLPGISANMVNSYYEHAFGFTLEDYPKEMIEK